MLFTVALVNDDPLSQWRASAVAMPLTLLYSCVGTAQLMIISPLQPSNNEPPSVVTDAGSVNSLMPVQ